MQIRRVNRSAVEIRASKFRPDLVRNRFVQQTLRKFGGRTVSIEGVRVKQFSAPATHAKKSVGAVRLGSGNKKATCLEPGNRFADGEFDFVVARRVVGVHAGGTKTCLRREPESRQTTGSERF